MELASVAAVAENGAIGRDGELPWEHIEADVEQYRARVAGHPVVLGRRTFESMLDDLPGRAQVVVSRTAREYDVETAHHAGSVEEAIEVAESLATDLDTDTAYVIGGGAIYALFQPHVDRMVLSRILGEYEGDTYFPEWDREAWTLVGRTEYDEFALEEWVRDDRVEA